MLVRVEYICQTGVSSLKSTVRFRDCLLLSTLGSYSINFEFRELVLMRLLLDDLIGTVLLYCAYCKCQFVLDLFRACDENIRNNTITWIRQDIIVDVYLLVHTVCCIFFRDFF